ncbi:MAG TPA: DUF433 domain-containing protein [Thermoanaerobaculia bacterium]|nr:DUF433 domain-containing protein [Thermoanaerobaculia bacterium]
MATTGQTSPPASAEALTLFRGIHPREIPLYGLYEAARYLHLPATTLRSWVEGRTYSAGGQAHFSEGLIKRPHASDPRLSFTNLVEAYVLRALRTRHSVSMKDVRRARGYAEQEFGITRLFISEKLLAAPGEVFLKEYGRLLSLSSAGQYAMGMVLERYLQRVVRDLELLPVRLYPFVGSEEDSKQIIAIDPRLSYGRPSLASKGISTAILAERVNGGEKPEDLASYYQVDQSDVEAALIYETRAA